MIFDSDFLEEFKDLYDEWIEVPTAVNLEYTRAAKRMLRRNMEFVDFTCEPFHLTCRVKGQTYLVRMMGDSAVAMAIPEKVAA